MGIVRPGTCTARPPDMDTLLRQVFLTDMDTGRPAFPTDMGIAPRPRDTGKCPR
jgi:hypothetical protein